MKTSVERVDDTTVKLTVTVEAERVERAIADAAKRLAQEAKIPGFRPGKAPRRVLETRLGPGALVQEAVRGALPDFYAEAAADAELQVVGSPEFDVETFTDGEDAVFTATVEVVPEIDVPDYAGLRVVHPEWELTDEEFGEYLDQLRERFATLETVKRGADVGDHVVVSVTGTRDGEQVDEASASDVVYELRDPQETQSELDRNLVGAEAGAILEFTDTLGADYGDLAGQELDFRTIVKEVKAKKLPELDDDFAAEASEFDTMDELRSELRSQLGEQKLSHARQALRGRVVETVCEGIEVPLPDPLVQQEVQLRIGRLAQEAERHGLSLEQYLQAIGSDTSELLERFQEEAKAAVTAQLVVDAIGREADIDVTQEDLSEEISRQAARLGRDPQELADLMSHPDRVGALVSDTFRRKTIDHLLTEVEVLSGPPDDLGADDGDDVVADEAIQAAAADSVESEDPADQPSSDEAG